MIPLCWRKLFYCIYVGDSCASRRIALVGADSFMFSVSEAICYFLEFNVFLHEL